MESIAPYTIWMILVFAIGYFFIIIEHLIKVDKATTALLTGIILWVIQYLFSGGTCEKSFACLRDHIGNISQILFFLLGALAIVEIINAHKGFTVVASALHVRTANELFWTIGVITFLLSSVLDNLTTSIVMITLLRKLMAHREQRWLIGGGIVIAANAGGAWSPIGDVTTTMLWIDGQLSTMPIIRHLLLPSLAVLVSSFFILSFAVKKGPQKLIPLQDKQIEPLGKLIFFLGIGILFFVPVFKMITGLPPFMGILLGLAILWLVTDLLHGKYRDREHLRMPSVLKKIDLSSLLFFLGILLAIDALHSASILNAMARWFDRNVANSTMIAILIGLASAIVDNVPLVAASMGMYSLQQYPPDHSFWQLVALCAGTGGSILVIGSAAGVVYMGLEEVDFLWYLRKISFSALVGYIVGVGVYLLQ